METEIYEPFNTVYHSVLDIMEKIYTEIDSIKEIELYTWY